MRFSLKIKYIVHERYKGYMVDAFLKEKLIE
jgi:hypothetical protein